MFISDEQFTKYEQRAEGVELGKEPVVHYSDFKNLKKDLLES